MTVERFEIELYHRPSKPHHYEPGDPVTGSVFIHSTTDLVFDDFYIELKGHAKVAWSEGDPHHGPPYSAEEEYVDTRHNFVQHIVGCRNELAQGKHQYPFVLHLPMKIPPSYAGAHGKIEYTLRCLMKRSWHEQDQSCETQLTVCSEVDLNKMPEAQIARKTSINKEKMLFRPGNILAMLFLDKTGYVPGETIHVSGRIENHSNFSVESSIVQLIQRETCAASNSRKVAEKVIFQLKKGKISQSETMLWNREAIEVPFIPPSGLPHCNLIDVSYEIKLIVNPGLFTSNLVDSLKILIGNVPLESVAENLADQP